MIQAVSGGQVFQLKADFSLIVLWPFDAVRSQRMRTAYNIQNIPTRITTLPLTSVGVEEVAVQSVPSEFVIKPNAVVTGDTGSRLAEHLIDTANKVALWNAPTLTVLGRDSGNEHGLGVW